MFDPPDVTAVRNLLTAASSTFFSEESRFLAFRSAAFLLACLRQMRHSAVK